MNSSEGPVTLDNSNRLLAMEAPRGCASPAGLPSGEENIDHPAALPLRDIALLGGTGLGLTPTA